MLHIKHTGSRGRGVYASAAIEPNTIVERSPVLLFSKKEYATHGRHTLLDHYTFNWPDGRMALALGIGSLFNHSSRPNTSFAVKPHPEQPTVQFTVLRRVEPGEELCIFYAHTLWFTPDDPADASLAVEQHEEPPFDLLRIALDEEPEDSVETLQAWAVDVPDTKDINPLLDWTRKAGLDRELRHLKRIRRVQTPDESRISILLCPSNTPVPALADDYTHLTPYILRVPARPALTMAHLALKNAVWPTVYSPIRPDPDEVKALEWNAERREWVLACVRELVQEALHARCAGELPIAALLPRERDGDSVIALAHDTRTSECHPLRHAVTNLVRRVGALQSDAARGEEYLLTGRTLFLTHEPCIMCSMALVHSRVKEVYILKPMARTGGAGLDDDEQRGSKSSSDDARSGGGPDAQREGVVGADATARSGLGERKRVMVVALPNINHRYRVWRWRMDRRVENELRFGALEIPGNVDA